MTLFCVHILVTKLAYLIEWDVTYMTCMSLWVCVSVLCQLKETEAQCHYIENEALVC